MAESTSTPTIPSEWGAAVAAKVARAIRNACGVEAEKYYLAADEIDGACDEAVKAALQVLAESFVIPGDVLAAPPTALSEAVASARADGVREGLERALEAAKDARKDYRPVLSKSRYQAHEIQQFFGGGCGLVAEDIQALINALPTPPTTPGGRTDG